MTSLTMLRFLTQKLKSQSINECQPYRNSNQLKDGGTESGTQAEDEKATRLECRTLSAGNPPTIDGEAEPTVLGATDYDGRFNSLLHITTQQQQQQHQQQQPPTRHSRPPCNSYFQLQQQHQQQQQQQHLLSEKQLLQQQHQQVQQQQQQRQQQQHHHHQLQRSDYTAAMERSLITEEDVKMEELQLSEDECQKENQQEQLQQQQQQQQQQQEEKEEQQAKLQPPHSHHHNHHHSPEQQQQQCEPKHTDVLSEENTVIPALSSSLEAEEVVVAVAGVAEAAVAVPAVSPQPTLKQQAALPSTTIHTLSLNKDTQVSISPSLSFDSEGEQQHTPSPQQQQQQQQQEENEKGIRQDAAQPLDQEYNMSDNAVETSPDSPLNQEVAMSTCSINSVNSETTTNLSNSISVPADDVPESNNTNTDSAVVAGDDSISSEPISIDRPHDLASLTETVDADTTTRRRKPDDVDGDQSMPVSVESQSPVSMVTASSRSVAVADQHSSEEELECINQENSHPEKRKWSQMMNGQNSSSISTNSLENNHPKSTIYHSFHPPHQQQQQQQNHHQQQQQQHHHPSHHHSHLQQNHHILQHQQQQQQQSNINHNQQHRSSSSNGNGNNGSGNNSNNTINSQQHCHNHNNNQHNSSSSSSNNNNSSSSNNNNNSILINNSNICNNNNNNNNINHNNINSNNNMNNNSSSNNNSCCFTDSAGSSDEEVKEFMLDPKPILFSSAPPSGIQKVMRSSSANFLVPNGPPLSICAISPRKRHRLNSSSDSLDLENMSVIQRPCLDFEKMQKTLMRKHTSHNVSRAKIVKIKTISGNGTSSKCWFDPALCSFRSISTAYSPLPPVEEPSCAY